MSAPIYLQDTGLVCALGQDKRTIAQRLLGSAHPNSLSWTARYSPAHAPDPLPLGVVPHVAPLPAQTLAHHRTRCNALLWQATQPLLPAIAHARHYYGAHRIAVVLGTSTAGLPEGEHARRHWQQHQQWPAGFDYAQQELNNPSQFLAHQLQLQGLQYTIATACSSGAKALASAARLLDAGLADAVIAGGCDVLSHFTVAGFSALESVSSQICQPLSANRCGINLGEAAAVFLVSRESPAGTGCGTATGPAVRLLGWGETTDAHHMSAPDPCGHGAIVAMQQALHRAALEPAQIDYVNLHGTATVQNDAMESLAVHTVLGAQVPVSSTKPLTGHTLAAAGALEAAFAWLTLAHNPQGLLPPHWWDGTADPALAPTSPVRPGQQLGRPLLYALSNSFAFGGSNACLILGATP